MHISPSYRRKRRQEGFRARSFRCFFTTASVRDDLRTCIGAIFRFLLGVGTLVVASAFTVLVSLHMLFCTSVLQSTTCQFQFMWRLSPRFLIWWFEHLHFECSSGCQCNVNPSNSVPVFSPSFSLDKFLSMASTKDGQTRSLEMLSTWEKIASKSSISKRDPFRIWGRQEMRPHGLRYWIGCCRCSGREACWAGNRACSCLRVQQRIEMKCARTERTEQNKTKEAESLLSWGVKSQVTSHKF